MNTPNWMGLAKAEIGTKTFPKVTSNPRIEKYHQWTNIQGYYDKAAWCSSFLNWVLTKSGISGTNSALARSWLEWGLLLKEPQFDCIVVLEKENPNGCQGHVEFFTKIKNDRIFLSPAVSLRLQM